MRLLFLMLISILCTASTINGTYNHNEVRLSGEEKKLYQLITAYRKSKKLPFIPISPALTFVAQNHVRDLQKNFPFEGDCNLHSWSEDGPWSPCCYTGNSYTAYCVWDKPKELTDYPAAGFEIAAYMSSGIDASTALKMWKKSPGHNAMIINKNGWTNKWNAIGVGIYENFAVVWFGKESDANELD